MVGTSLIPEQEKLNALRQILPEAFSEGKIEYKVVNKVGQLIE